MVLPANSELFGLLYDSRHYDPTGASADVADRPKEDAPMK
jgi:hypothetical protein